LSFRRPNFPASMYEPPKPRNSQIRSELWILNWLREAKYEVDVYSDIDFHCGVEGLQDYKAVIVGAHSEYWSVEMMDHLQGYLDGGGHLLYLGGNGLYRKVEYSDDLDALAHISNVLLRDAYPFPERYILGVQYPACTPSEPDLIGGGNFGPYRVSLATHPFFAGTGVSDGDPIGSSGKNGPASGWEVDWLTPEPDPSRLEGSRENPFVLASGDHGDGLVPRNMIHYDHPGGGFVFSVGSINFSGSLAVDEMLQQILSNVLDAALSS